MWLTAKLQVQVEYIKDHKKMNIEFHVWLIQIILQVFETNEQTQNPVIDTEKTNVNS